MSTHAPTHRAHKPLNQYCVHCGRKCGGPECRPCRGLPEESRKRFPNDHDYKAASDRELDLFELMYGS